MNYSEDVGRAAHCRRVAAYSDQIAARLKLSARDRALVRQLAMRHHGIPQAFGGDAAERLASDLGVRVTVSGTPGTMFDQLVAAFAGRSGEGAAELRELAALVDVADDFDTEIEYLAYCDMPAGRSLRRAAEDVFEHPAAALLLPEFSRYSRQKLAELVHKLPVFPTAALDVVRAVRGGTLSGEQVVQLASRDPVLAGCLLSAANGAAYTWAGTVRTVRSAVMYLGEVRAAGVLMTAAVKPILGSAAFQGLWEHSSAAATVCEQMAAVTGCLPASDAYTVGLLHDVGRLLIQLPPPEVTSARQKLIQNGCAPAVAEVLTCGATHGEAGADVLRHWKLPEEYAEAVEFHHEPEHAESPLASLLYLAEHCTDSEEDLPSAARMKHAMERVRITDEQLQSIVPAHAGARHARGKMLD